MLNYKIIEINDSNVSSLENLAVKALAEGHSSVRRTIDDWKDGSNTFSKSGEKFWGAFISGECIAVGGLNTDPYINDETVGRVRHLYVSEKYRNHGLAKALLRLILTLAKKQYTSIRLSTKNPIAGSLYESHGFSKVTGDHVTHEIKDIRNHIII
jgi:ribosomal protein S18 acetylase RimI-like enzyme